MPKSKEQSLEQALKNLETIVSKLESQEASLEESLKLFEEGVVLARRCQQELSQAKNRVDIFLKETQTLTPFTEGDPVP